MSTPLPLRASGSCSTSTAPVRSGEVYGSLSYDEKPGVPAIGTTAPDLPPGPGIPPTMARDHE
jgi:hypothetical protein